MKYLAVGIGEEFHDLDNIRDLIRYLNLTAYQQVLDIITQYYLLKKFAQKVLYVLDALLTNPK